MLIRTLLERSYSQALSSAAQIIKSECSEFLSNPTMLLRGIERRDEELYIRNAVRTDRKSRSGRTVGSILFNAFIDEEFGIPDVRNRCHFVTNTYSEARKYGAAHLAFPVNGAKVLSNPSIDDSINTVGETWYIITRDLRPLVTKEDTDIIHQVVVKLNQPGATIADIEPLFVDLSDKAAAQVQRNWDDAKELTTKGYQITGVNAVPKYSQPVEYMVFDATHTNLLNLDMLAKELGTYDTGGAADTFKAFLDYIETI